MSFISILLALLLEQARPLAHGNFAHHGVRIWVRWAVRSCDAGMPQHGWLAWFFAVGFWAALSCLVHWLLVWTSGWLLTMAFHVLILYLTLGFRQFSHHFTAIRDALDAGDEQQARQLLAQWMHIDSSDLPRSEIVRHVIEHSVLSAHRHVFGVFTWYTLLAALGLGPAGAVLYRVGEYMCHWVNRPAQPAGHIVSAAVTLVANRAWFLLDWIPVRITALSFAFVGSFEETVDSWRRHAAQVPDDNDGIILAATAGAINVQLGSDHGPGLGQMPQPVHLGAVVGLVWRTVVMWMVFLALLSLARLIG